ncbi:HutD/Ves family protein [Derxia gummosa]|uniref:HutD/Ves family protein n=1 Tax=Derxia gummosa DSM 723 TaxID=1121388 RepID=A0A8B6X920_9BURK|nr:HutD family protein [Derxia gummosa]
MTTMPPVPPALDRPQRYDLADLREEPWRNNRGITRTVAAGIVGAPLWPVVEGEPDWRVSIADIHEDGPFSVFEGMDRESVLVMGHGLHLSAPGTSLRFNKPGDTGAYPGEMPIDGRLGSGPARLFNVITRRDVTKARVQILRDHAFASVPGSTWVVHAIDGHWQGDDALHAPLTVGCGLVIPAQAERVLLVPTAPGAVLVTVRIDAA